MLAIFTYHLSVKIRITCADDVSDFVFIVGLSNWVRNYSRKFLYVFPIIISKIASTRYICLMGYSFKLFFINILQRPERNIVLWFDHGYCLRRVTWFIDDLQRLFGALRQWVTKPKVPSLCSHSLSALHQGLISKLVILYSIAFLILFLISSFRPWLRHQLRSSSALSVK